LGLGGSLDAEKEIFDVERKGVRGYEPVFDPIDRPLKSKDGLDFTDIKTLTSPLPKGLKLQCCVMRNKGRLGVHPTFEMYLEEPNQFLLAGRKKSSKSSNYVITKDKIDFDKGEN